MKRILAGALFLGSFAFSQFLEGEVVREFGVKTGVVSVKYDSIDGTKPSRTLEEFLSVYTFIGAGTAMGFTAGVSLELSTGSKMTSGRTIIYNALELNPSVEVSFSENLRGFVGFGGSINRFKERAGSSVNKDMNLGLQFFFGAKLNFTPVFGVLGEYKGKIFMTGDYDGNFVNHLNVGLFLLLR
ncbi:MAG: hypothetical protein Q9N26_04385 [Aquificota bacterium]|nr:hypothetical protein [Aquificota bacterium]